LQTAKAVCQDKALLCLTFYFLLIIKSKSLIRSKEELLGTNLIEFKVIEGKVVIEPVRDVGGILKKYVKKSLPFEKERELAWEKVADEKKCV